MEINQISGDSVQDFLRNFLPKETSQSDENQQQGSKPTAEVTQEGFSAPIRGVGDLADKSKNPEQGSNENSEKEGQEEEGKKEEGDQEDAVQKVLKGSESTSTEKKPEVKDFRELASKLIEDKVLYGFEGGEKVETLEDFVELVKGNLELRDQQDLQKMWDEKIQSLHPDAQLVLRYAEAGVTDAREYARLINNVAQAHQVGELDPTKEVDQERIVTIQLVNSGLSKEAAEDTIKDLKESKKLELRAKEYFPILKRSHEDRIREQFENQRIEEEERNSLLQTNAVNVKSFLDNEEAYLPFKIQSTKQKAVIYDLATKPVEVREDGEITYGWETYIRSLQYGNEDQYKEFMKVMTFLSGSKKYDEALSKIASNEAKQKSFTKKVSTSAKPNSIGSEEPDQIIQAPKRTSGSVWSVSR